MMSDINFYMGLGNAVAERTILRRREDGTWETWADVAHRVATGNASLSSTFEERDREYEIMRRLIGKGVMLMAGRHLQHGDETQRTKNIEIYTNCSTSATSFMTFYLLLNGSGVGRSYDDDFLLVNYDNAPKLCLVIDEKHPDYNPLLHESVREARHRYGDSRDALWFQVPDSREGWAQALEIWETAAFEKIHKDKLLVLDFSLVRPSGTPIMGLQGKPASGPAPLMHAFQMSGSVKGMGIPKWRQAMLIDHYFAACVVLGGARRSSRMATKIWRDRSVLDFIQIKRPIEFKGLKPAEIDAYVAQHGQPMGFLWTSNNSVVVDEEFWRLAQLPSRHRDYTKPLAKHARKVFSLLTKCAWGDGTGEPGIINGHHLVRNDRGMDSAPDSWSDGGRYTVREESRLYLARLHRRAQTIKLPMITNPCVSGDTLILTSTGYHRIDSLVNKEVKVWNGEEWSVTTPQITGHDQKMLRITFSDGSTLRCTEAHRFYLADGYSGQMTHTQARNLEVGMKLIKWSLPVIEGTQLLPSAYSQGFYSADGTADKNYAYVYSPKFSVLPRLNATITENETDTDQNRVKATFNFKVNEKNYVPSSQITVESKLNWLAGLIDGDGTITKDGNIQITSIDQKFLIQVKMMLSTLGVHSKVTQATEAKRRLMPNGHGGSRLYDCQTCYRLLLSAKSLVQLKELGLYTNRVNIDDINPNRDASRFISVQSVEPDGVDVLVYCFKESKRGMGIFNGILTGQCGEIPLHVLGGYCLLGDVAPYFADSLDEFEEAVRATVRALIRTNLLPAVYQHEVRRTNRIGVSLTGIHEFAFKHFGLTFRELLDERESSSFWEALARMSRAAVDEADRYSKELGLNPPHTVTTIKPSGSVSKLFGLSEGWHLPAQSFYLRWVQFRSGDPLIKEYESKGYPVRKLETYNDTFIIGFPTAPRIAEIMPAEQITTASMASITEHFQWLYLGERYWIRGTHSGGVPLPVDRGGQISYTIKYNKKDVTLPEFRYTLHRWQPVIKVASILPLTDQSAYEYLPEEPITYDVYTELMGRINRLDSRSGIQVSGILDISTLNCDTGACPVDIRSDIDMLQISSQVLETTSDK